MGFGNRSKEQAERESQFWWAFSCLVLAGRRGAVEFHTETLRRGSGSYATEDEAEKIVDEAVSHLADVFNAALGSRTTNNGGGESGWKRHVLALTMRPDGAQNSAVDE